jgi:DNA-binding SARP family transcriptional activator
MAESLRFHVLGPLEVLASEIITIAGQRDRVVLAMLLLEPDRIVSVDRLVDAVWPERPPSTARKQIQSCVMRLRKVLSIGGNRGDHMIVTTYPGYCLRPGKHIVDHLEFSSRTRELASKQIEGSVSPSELAHAIREALSLWRGVALDGMNAACFESETARLEEMRLSAVEWLMDVELSTGRDRELIGELVLLVNNHPFHENFRRQLMTAQYRAGRRMDAVATYDDFRRLLRDEMGSVPGEALRRLHDAVLNDDPARVGSEVSPPPGMTNWAGRDPVGLAHAG